MRSHSLARSISLATLLLIVDAAAHPTGANSLTQYEAGPNIQISSSAAKLPHYETSVSADPRNRRLRSIEMELWVFSGYDRRDNPDNIGYWVRFSASLDGGETWLPSVRVSTARNSASNDTRKNSGDTVGLAADADGAFHPIWIDNRTGVPQMWTAAVRVRAKAHR